MNRHPTYGIRDNHHPFLCGLVPDDLWIAELRWVCATGHDHGVILVLGERVAIIV
jgi:hypothetical protein